MNPDNTPSGAEFSVCRRYRYALWRHWDWKGYDNCVLFLGLNPSKADETTNDMTIKKCIGFAKKWGFGGMFMLNLYAYIATKPDHMAAADDPIGPGNDEALMYYQQSVGQVIAAWGSIKQKHRLKLKWGSRVDHVILRMGRAQWCLGRTKDNSPKHPSRLAYATERQLFWTAT